MKILYALLGKPRPRPIVRFDATDAEVQFDEALESLGAPKRRIEAALQPTGFPLGDGVLGRRGKPSNNSREHEG